MKYYPKIDGLRFVAIFFVLIAHYAPYVARFFVAGWTGVDLFFIISGFLITSILLSADNHTFRLSYKNFIIRRTLRIFPLYYSLTFILLAVNIPSVRDHLFYILTYTYNYDIINSDIQNNWVPHFWSLSVEEQFYLFWPFIIIPLNKRKRLLIVIVISIIILSYIQFTFGVVKSINKYNFYGAFPRMGSLSLGALIALFKRENLVPHKIFNSQTIEAFVFILSISASAIQFPGSFTIISFCCFFIVFKSIQNGFTFSYVNAILTNRRIIQIGKLSYGIYLFHFPVMMCLDKYFNDFWTAIDWNMFGPLKIIRWHSYIIKFPFYSLITIIISHWSYKTVEQPILKLKKNFTKSLAC